MDTSQLRDYATVVTAIVALSVFALNSYAQIRNRRIENLSRFIEAHLRLFDEGSYIAQNIAAIESRTLVRDPTNCDMERKFHLMLLEIEHLAILANNKAVPRPTQVYMFGSYASELLKVITQAERESMAWELAIGFLDRLAKDTDAYQQLTRKQRERFWL
ncbi:hypothetical protein ETAA8_07090 [Anatilimnocola aggregata]|uniref:Uncharacterized protein n=1 Tax=Anatilimnocola aggregata TaxID=2528021 RepID=A0A517Y5X4_9BACT|nr:hypothetical protein [Anatilimnocola aggregata]QDU25639.1 hypothetical protein ETAA8_07090 [Anatilimnocola aggregata]